MPAAMSDGRDGGEPLLGGRQPTDGADQRGDSGAADADAQQDAADEKIIGGGGRIHEVEPANGGKHANDDDPTSAELVDQAAGKRCSEAHRELRERHRQAEGLAADVEGLRDVGQVEAHGLGTAHGEADDGADDQDQQPER
jgi:hypothetical protein